MCALLQKTALISHNLRKKQDIQAKLHLTNDKRPAGFDSMSADTHPAGSVPGIQSDHPELHLAFEQEQERL